MSKISTYVQVMSVSCELPDAPDRPGEIVVCRPSTANVSGVAALLSEMQSHYGRPVPYAAARVAAVRACRPPSSEFDPRVLLAIRDDLVVGSIVMNVTFPAFELSLSLHIRDLYVAKSARRQGIGRMLVRSAARLAVNEGYSALEWTTDATNTAARQMYEVCGAKLLDRVYYRLFDDALRSTAGESSSFLTLEVH
jgi:GNAT superfamily N-acetyltransferase